MRILFCVIIVSCLRLGEVNMKNNVGAVLIDMPLVRNPTIDNLPSVKQLDALCVNKGDLSGLMFAWRCSLRALPFLTSEHTLPIIWKTKYQQHVGLLVRINILLQSRFLDSPPKFVDFESLNDSIYLASSVAEAARAACRSTYSATRIIDSIESSEIASFAFEAAIEAVNAIVSYSQSNHYGVVEVRSEDKDLLSIFIKNCTWDYNRLLGAPFDQLGKLEPWALWGKEVPRTINSLQEKFVSELRFLKMDFLAKDIQKVWHGELIESKRLNKYSGDTSEEITGDVESFSRHVEDFEDAKENPAVRAMLMGPGGAGKSSLRDLLLKRETELKQDATPGIVCDEVNFEKLNEIHRKVLRGIDYGGLELSLWDFGGQSIFHNLHRGFMSRENCVYVLVVDSRHEQSPDEWLAQIREHILENMEYRPLDLVERYKDPYKTVVSVFLITNCYEGVEREQNQRRLLREYPDLLTPQSFFTFRCDLATEKFDKFLRTLIVDCCKSKHQISGSTFQAIRTLKQVFNRDCFFSVNEIRGELNVDGIAKLDEWNRLKEKLETLGVILFNGSEDYCLDSDWVVKQSFKVLNDSLIRENGGVISLPDLKQKVIGLNAESDKLIEFLLKYKVTHSYSSNTKQFYFFPDAANQNEPQKLNNFFRNNDSQSLVIIEYQFKSIPLGFQSHFAVKILKHTSFKIELPEDIWGDGLFAIWKREVCVLVEYKFNRQKIKISFFNFNEFKYLSELVGEIDEIINETGRFANSVIPILTHAPCEFNLKQRGEIFKRVNFYKKIEKVKVEDFQSEGVRWQKIGVLVAILAIIVTAAFGL